MNFLAQLSPRMLALLPWVLFALVWADGSDGRFCPRMA